MHYMTTLVNMPLVREQSGAQLKTPSEVHTLCGDLTGLAQECFHVLSLSTRNRLLNRHMVSMGLVDASLVHPREVFRQAILDSATACILVHNHPGRDVTPSAEDLRITRQLVEAGKIIDIRVLDHVIVARPATGDGRGWLSMREDGLVEFG